MNAAQSDAEPLLDLRSYLDLLEEEGELCRVDAPVDWNLEVGAIQRVMFDRGGPGLLFTNVRDSNAPLASGLMGTVRRAALGLRTEPTMRAVIQKVLRASTNPIQPAMTETAACQENVVLGDDIDLNSLPVPMWHSGDGGRYLGTLGLAITRDPETGIRNVGIYREQISSPRTLLLNATQQVGLILQKYRRLGKKMPIATVVGVDPNVLVASCVQARLGDDELGIAGGLIGRPLELVRCVSQDIEVPATAEFVFEGEIDPSAPLVHEGPFGEFTGYYGLDTMAPAIELTAVTHRTNPVFQGTLEDAPPSESTVLRQIGAAAGLWMKIAAAKIPGVKDVYLTDMACVSFMAVIQLDKQLYFGHAHDVIQFVFSATATKWVIVVDSDVDIYDRGQVEWALATRVQPHRDIWVTEKKTRGIPLDPAIAPEDSVFPNVRTSRVGIDATEGFKGHDFGTLCRADADLIEQVLHRWDELGLPSL